MDDTLSYWKFTDVTYVKYLGALGCKDTNTAQNVMYGDDFLRKPNMTAEIKDTAPVKNLYQKHLMKSRSPWTLKDMEHAHLHGYDKN